MRKFIKDNWLECCIVFVIAFVAAEAAIITNTVIVNLFR
jgi:hypothetical protein